MLTPQNTMRKHRPATRVLTLFVAAVLTVAAALGAASTSQALSAPTNVTATVQGSSAVQVTWTAVSGATNYAVQYSKSSSFSSPTSVVVASPEAVVTGLTVNTTYYFRVAASTAAGSTTGNSWSSSKSAKPVYTYAAPTGLAVDNMGGTSIELHWNAISGAPGYRVRAYSSGNPTVYQSTNTNAIVLTGLKKSTNYYISVYVEQPATGSLPALQQGPNSSEIQQTTSSYELAAPSDFAVASQAPTSVGLTWTAPTGMQPGYVYQIQYALDTAMSSGMKYYSQTTSGTSITVNGLSPDTNYYMRIRVIDASGAQKSDRSDYILAKTRLATGVISGKVTGAPTGDIVVDAFTTNSELAAQSNVASDGSYSLTVRPGTYRIHVTYVGSSNYTSLWARSGTDGGRVTSEASDVSVSTGATVTAPQVKLGAGAVVNGKVVDPSGNAISSVDVSVLSGSTSEREVIELGRTDSSGNYSIHGLPDGQYWLRYLYGGDGFANRSIWIDVSGRQVVAFRVSTDSNATTVNGVTSLNAKLDLAQFRKTYGAYISGTKTVGKTLTASATAWLAGSYPTTTASMSFQWKRNGTAISGATGQTYKLTSSDKGKYITVTATAKRYGYETGTVTSKSYKIS